MKPESTDSVRPPGTAAGAGAGAVAGPDPDTLRYDERGLLPVVVQDVGSGAVLMLAYADRQAVALTLATGQAHFFSRSRGRLWRKGEQSGNVLAVVEVLADCDGDALLVRARPAGPTCHRGTRSCFEPNAAALELGWLARVVASRRGADPDESYTARLFAAGVARIAQKVGEEAVEVVVASLAPGVAPAAHGAPAAGSGAPADAPSGGPPRAAGAAAPDGALAAGGAREGRRELVAEGSDLLFHLLVLLADRGVEPGEIAAELSRRHFGPAVLPREGDW
jgi:phosphoribosyl-ATP pyrophosphohydrolase/phosphoribosyl-AMP cyclohydrolase